MLPLEGLEYLAREEINKSALRRDLENQKKDSPIRSRNVKLDEIGRIQQQTTIRKNREMNRYFDRDTDPMGLRVRPNRKVPSPFGTDIDLPPHDSLKREAQSRFEYKNRGGSVF